MLEIRKVERFRILNSYSGRKLLLLQPVIGFKQLVLRALFTPMARLTSWQRSMPQQGHAGWKPLQKSDSFINEMPGFKLQTRLGFNAQSVYGETDTTRRGVVGQRP